MDPYTVVPIEPLLAPILFHDLLLSEVLSLIQQLGFSEVIMLDPNQLLSTVSVDRDGVVHVVNLSVATSPKLPPPSGMS